MHSEELTKRIDEIKQALHNNHIGMITRFELATDLKRFLTLPGKYKLASAKADKLIFDEYLISDKELRQYARAKKMKINESDWNRFNKGECSISDIVIDIKPFDPDIGKVKKIDELISLSNSIILEFKEIMLSVWDTLDDEYRIKYNSQLLDLMELILLTVKSVNQKNN